MVAQYLAGIDIGTTGTRTIIYDLRGRSLARAYREYGCVYPRPSWVEQDLEYLIAQSFAASNEALQEAGIDAKAIAGIGLSTHSGSIVLLDASGKLVRPMISWLDTRNATEMEDIKRLIPVEKYYRASGRPVGPEWFLPKMLWLRKNEPDNWRKTVKVLQVQDMALHAYGDPGYHEDIAECSKFGLWDVFTLGWSAELLDLFDIDPALLPHPTPSGTMIGRVPRDVAEKTGFAEGTPVSVGARDTICVAVGAGMTEPGIVCVNLGTSGVVLGCLDEPRPDPSSRIEINNHAMPGRWQMEGNVPTAGACYRWFRDNIGLPEREEGVRRGIDPYELLNALAGQSPAGSKGLLFLPFFAGSYAPYWDTSLRACYLGLDFAHDRACMARAIMEGVSMHLRNVMGCMQSAGVRIERLRLLGGASRSSLWNQIQADVYGRTCELVRNAEDATTLGAAIMGGVGAGVFRDIPEGVRAMVEVVSEVTPRTENAAMYSDLLEVFTSAVDSLLNGGVFERLVEFRAQGIPE